MSDHDHSEPNDPRVEPESTTGAESPVSTGWPAVNTPWGTPGNHLTGPIPRIRRRDDGSPTHGEES